MGFRWNPPELMEEGKVLGNCWRGEGVIVVGNDGGRGSYGGEREWCRVLERGTSPGLVVAHVHASFPVSTCHFPCPRVISQWTCWFDSDHASDHSILLSHFQSVCELVNLTLTIPLTIPFCFLILKSMWTCWFDSDHPSDNSILLSHFQPVCEVADLPLTMPLTILLCFLISSLYVNWLICLWPCLWPFHFSFSFTGSMLTCWFDSDHTFHHFILLSHFQLVTTPLRYKETHLLSQKLRNFSVL